LDFFFILAANTYREFFEFSSSNDTPMALFLSFNNMVFTRSFKNIFEPTDSMLLQSHNTKPDFLLWEEIGSLP